MIADELIDVLDENGVFTGAVRPRSAVHANGDWHRTVHVWVTDPAGRLLLQRRAASKESYPGTWDVSAAGHIASGGTAVAAALRELEEELGIKAAKRDLRYLFTTRASVKLYNGRFLDNEISDVFLVLRDIAEADIRFDHNEVEAVALFDIGDLARRLAAADPAFVPHGDEYAKLFGFLK
jgi:isopentenyl-diphosphate delta-isomerase type 1